ncbi:MAG TPA: sigma-70 family RNA polymerase sigma factor [Planctomycetes bacterium]|nr:sigma-70 family RNA polymerase sigma factor [Planctomycetota bacterium]
MDTTDSELVARVLGGESERFHDLVNRHTGPLWSTIRGSVSNVEDAREILQETWMRAFERLDRLREPGRLRSWLLSISLNLVRQRHRRRGVVEAEPNEGLDRFPDEAREGAAERAEQKDEVESMRRRIAGLPPRQRQVLDLRLNHELSHAEIASVLGISAESSRANYYQAVRKLRSADDSPTTEKR